MYNQDAFAIDGAIRDNAGFLSNTLARNDDGSTGCVDIGFDVDFFGAVFSCLFVNNNGNITFDTNLSTFTPFDLTSTGRQIIAPFFGDVDTRSAGSPVTYGQDVVNGRPAFAANWIDVDCFSSSSSRDSNIRNSFQLVIIDRSDIAPKDFDFEFNFDKIAWESGQASGSNFDCLGGVSARVGFSDGTGDPDTFFELPGSAVNGAFLDNGPADTALILNSLNSDVDGRYLFTVRSGQVSPEPEPDKFCINYDFEANGLDDFSGIVSIEPVQGYSVDGFDGSFLRNDSPLAGGNFAQFTNLILTDLPEHTTVDIGFLLAIIDSWDGPGSFGPDNFNVAIGESIIFSENFPLSSPPPDVEIARGVDRGFNSGFLDASYDMSKHPDLQDIPHTSGTLAIGFVASGPVWQGGNDESWAIDNLEVCLDAEPEPVVQTGGGGDNQWDTRPSFGISHETRQDQIVENGFSFNSEYFTLTDNHWTDFAEQSIEIGMVNTFSATVWADKGLKVQEFLFGIPDVGMSHLAELGIEIWYDINGEIQDVIVVQNSHVIDADTISVSHEMTKCLSTDEEARCDTTTVSMTFLEPLQDKVMAIKAIDWKNRDQRTYLNDGFDISGKSLNPMLAKMIPSTVRDEGLLKVTQVAKYSPYWVTDDDRMFEMNSFGSFKQINQSFERFQDTGTAYTRMHSGFGGIIAYEQDRAVDIFDASNLVSELPASFAYIYPETGQRITDEMRQAMLLQEQIAKGILDEMDRQDRHY